MLLLGLVAALRWPLRTGEEMDLSPAPPWPEPHVALDLQPAERPGLVTVEDRVAPPQPEALWQALREVQLIRRRDGAPRWELFPDTADPERFLEPFVGTAWAAPLRQHARVRWSTRRWKHALVLQQPGTTPVVSQFIARSVGRGRRRAKRTAAADTD